MRLFTVEPPPPKPVKRFARLRAALLITTLTLAALCAFVIARAVPRMNKLVGAAVRTIASAEVDEAILNYMEINGLTYGSLVNMRFDNNGAVASVTADTAKIDSMIAHFDDEIGTELEEKVLETEVPLNVLLGIETFRGAGPKLKVHYLPINVVNVQVRHEFTSQGINQTLHTILLSVSVEVEVFLPLHTRREEISTEIPIGQTLIVGGVPSTYLDR